MGIDHLVVTASAAAADENGTSALTLAFGDAATLFAKRRQRDGEGVAGPWRKADADRHRRSVTDNGDGTFTLTAHSVADLSGLTITPASEFEGTVQVGVSAVAQVGTVDSAVGSTSTDLTVNPVSDTPSVSVPGATVVLDENTSHAITGVSVTSATWR